MDTHDIHGARHACLTLFWRFYYVAVNNDDSVPWPWKVKAYGKTTWQLACSEQDACTHAYRGIAYPAIWIQGDDSCGNPISM